MNIVSAEKLNYCILLIRIPHSCSMRKRPPPSKLVRGLSVFRRRLKFPGGRPPSIVSAEKLNYCVRNGNRCDLLAIATEETFRFINCRYFLDIKINFISEATT